MNLVVRPYQPIAPRIRVVVIMAIIIMKPQARDVAALSSASEAVGAKRVIIGSQKCTREALRSTREAELCGKNCPSWQMGYNLRPDLTCPYHLIFEARQLLRADWAAGVELARGNADFRAEAELAAIRILR